jgi:hypothetical protein
LLKSAPPLYCGIESLSSDGIRMHRFLTKELAGNTARGNSFAF